MRRHSVRLDGRVTSVLIEDEFWLTLREWARASRRSLADLLSGITAEGAGGNFTSALRTACLRRLRERAERAEAELARLRAAGGNETALRLMDLLQQPCLLLDGQATVAHGNRAFLEWQRLTAAAARGRPLDSFVLRGARDAVQQLLQRSRLDRLPARGLLNVLADGQLHISPTTVLQLPEGGVLVLFERAGRGES